MWNKAELERTIFYLSLYHSAIRDCVEDAIEERKKEFKSSALLPDIRKISIFQVVKEWAEVMIDKGDLPQYVQNFIDSIKTRCDEKLSQLLKKLYFSGRGTVSYLVRMGALGKVKDGWKYIVWDPVFTQHRHYLGKHNSLRTKELLKVLRSRKFDPELIEKIVWDDLFTKDIIELSKNAEEKEISSLINNLLSIELLNRPVEWAEILAGKILTEIPEEARSTTLVKAVSERLLKNETHSSAKTLLEISGVKKDFCYSDAFIPEEETWSEFIDEDFFRENVNSKFWNLLLGEGEGVTREGIHKKVSNTIKIAAEPEMVFDPNAEIPIHFFSLYYYEYYFLKYKELSLRKMISELTSSLEIYLDWKKSINSRKDSIENITNICNNHRGATQVPITTGEETKPLMVWIEEFIKSPPKPHGVHENINIEIIENTRPQIELLTRIDRYGQYYGEVFREYKES